ncbi:MAG: virulence RhuM family protein [Bacteroidales bacterium]
MTNFLTTGEIIIFQDSDPTLQLEVRIEDETVWLSQAQMVNLFKATKQNISLHINNIFKEGELQQDSVVKEYLTTASDGKKYKIKFYNLDVIISVGYRVKSQRGTQFRIWATNVLRDYLLKGHAISYRVERIEKKLIEHEQKFDLLITNLPPNQGIFFDGQIFDAYTFVSDLVKSASKTIVLIDNYIDESVLLLLSKRKKGVKATIYTQQITRHIKQDLEKHNAQYEPVEILEFKKAHDRFMVIDQQRVYHIGASLKDLGKNWFAFSHININPVDIMKRLEN